MIAVSGGAFDSFGYNTDTLGALCDAFFVPGIFFAGIGCLVFISTTGFFDSLSYAVRFAAHALLPFVKIEKKSYYDYKVEKEDRREGRTSASLLIVGLVFIGISCIFLLVYSTI